MFVALMTALGPKQTFCDYTPNVCFMGITNVNIDTACLFGTLVTHQLTPNYV